MFQTDIESSVISNLKLNYKFHRLVFKLKKPCFVFNSGQYITLKVNNAVYRSYSIFSTPEQLPYWELLVDISPQGPGTRYLAGLKRGDIIVTSEPRGSLGITDRAFKTYLLGATGCGLAPLIPLISELKKTAAPAIQLYWGLSSEKEIILKEELDNWAKKINNSFNIIISQPEIGWTGKTGHINEYILEAATNADKANTAVCLTGASQMIQDLLIGLSAANFPLENIFFEQLYF